MLLNEWIEPEMSKIFKQNRLMSGELLQTIGERLASSKARHGLVRLALA